MANSISRSVYVETMNFGVWLNFSLGDRLKENLLPRTKNSFKTEKKIRKRNLQKDQFVWIQ
jgi:hypothetical protein